MQGTSTAPATPPRWQVPRLVRDGRMLAGVAGGVARELGVRPVVIRIAFVILTAAGGIGVPLYGALWLWMRWRADTHPDTEPYVPQPKGASEPARLTGVVLVMAGLVIAGETLDIGLGLTPSLAWPIALVGAGTVLALERTERRGEGWASTATEAARAMAEERRLTVARIVAGLILAAGGIVTLLVSRVDPGDLWTVGLAVVVTVAGLALVVAPWVWRIVGELTDERRRRIRSEERAAMAAHLHDSVLQTLALIQRHADDPALAAQLARRQERELRAWLFEGDRPAERSYRSALEEIAAETEELHRVAVEVVVVGDAPVGERDASLLAAIREAVVNAAEHAHAPRVDVFVEIGPEARDAFVRDTGVGFDPTAVPVDRRGIAESIVGRMQRAGGSARVESEPGAGTEIHLRLPVPP
jgi:signal transduction histidine kinase/phage shock protein PspC (stress-responsive transcriptional regulator)